MEKEEQEEEREESHLEASPHIHIKRQCQILLRAEIALGEKCFGSSGKSSCESSCASGSFFFFLQIGSRGKAMRGL